MTAASPGPNLFSILTNETDALFRPRKDAFLISLAGQAVAIALVIYLIGRGIPNPPKVVPPIPYPEKSPLVFTGHNGGGGGDGDPLPASNGTPPRALLETQIVAPTVIVPRELRKLMIEATVMMAPDVKFPISTQIGDPSSPFSKWLSDGPGGPGGIGAGCCDGIGPASGPHVGDGPPGVRPGHNGVTMPEAIYSPEPSFSDEARKAKFQGIVLLMIVVGKDGRPYNIRVLQSLGMGLDEKATEAVRNWRFRPAILNGEPVATEIGVQVDFHLY